MPYRIVQLTTVLNAYAYTNIQLPLNSEIMQINVRGYSASEKYRLNIYEGYFTTQPAGPLLCSDGIEDYSDIGQVPIHIHKICNVICETGKLSIWWYYNPAGTAITITIWYREVR